MVQSKKYRGVRQRQWGSCFSEIRYSLLKRGVWLGTFEMAEEAARAYDETAVLMSGRNAKINFPIQKARDAQLSEKHSAMISSKNLFEILSAKLRICCKNPSPSITCLRLDTEKSRIGIWQRRAGGRADSSWVKTVPLSKMELPVVKVDPLPSPSTSPEGTSEGIDDEERIALRMIKELQELPNFPFTWRDRARPIFQIVSIHFRLEILLAAQQRIYLGYR